MKFLLLTFTACAFAAPSAAGKPASIVGNWVFPEESCVNAIAIGPLSLKSEDVDCRFASVKRSGRRVTWKGICDDAEGSSQETVTATEKNGRLTIRYVNGGNVLKDLRRCEP
jgi:hypothetical protein